LRRGIRGASRRKKKDGATKVGLRGQIRRKKGDDVVVGGEGISTFPQKRDGETFVSHPDRALEKGSVISAGE